MAAFTNSILYFLTLCKYLTWIGEKKIDAKPPKLHLPLYTEDAHTLY
jgi:hypothetical protein